MGLSGLIKVIVFHSSLLFDQIIRRNADDF